ncbi:MAG: diguanylate cyclase, partial [Anaerolineales bacterium]|nr:diguanylate cyclase [Anaerolineales bacterium]
ALVAIQDVTARKKAEDYLRVAEALNAAFDANHVCARMSGDEFAVILENANESDAVDYIKQLEILIEPNNKYYRESELSLSLGFAVSAPGVSLEKIIGLADDAMYRNKSEHRRKDDPQA